MDSVTVEGVVRLVERVVEEANAVRLGSGATVPVAATETRTVAKAFRVVHLERAVAKVEDAAKLVTTALLSMARGDVARTERFAQVVVEMVALLLDTFHVLERISVARLDTPATVILLTLPSAVSPRPTPTPTSPPPPEPPPFHELRPPRVLDLPARLTLATMVPTTIFQTARTPTTRTARIVARPVPARLLVRARPRLDLLLLRLTVRRIGKPRLSSLVSLRSLLG